MIDKKIRNRVLFTVFFVIGVGLCIGGIWCSPLFAPGVAFIGGAIGMFQSVFAQESNTPKAAESNANQPTYRETHSVDSHNVTTNIHYNLEFNKPMMFSAVPSQDMASQAHPRDNAALTMV